MWRFLDPLHGTEICRHVEGTSGGRSHRLQVGVLGKKNDVLTHDDVYVVKNSVVDPDFSMGTQDPDPDSQPDPDSDPGGQK